MTPIQEKILYTLLDIENSQQKDSIYFKEGTSSDNIGDPKIIEPEISALEGLGYVQSFDLQNGLKGILLLQAGKDWILSDIASKKVITDQQIATAQALIETTEAKNVIDATDRNGIYWRAVALILIDEINNIRQWTGSFKAQVALASSLADLKTRVATLPNMPDRTLQQFKTAYTNKIDNGNAN